MVSSAAMHIDFRFLQQEFLVEAQAFESTSGLVAERAFCVLSVKSIVLQGP